MPSQLPSDLKIPGLDGNPVQSKHDLTTTRQTIKQLLADGTPDWIRFPNDYRAFVKESFQAEKEVSDQLARQYHMEGQDILTDVKARKVNALLTREFIRKLRSGGVKCFSIDNAFPPQTVALWAIPPHSNEAKYICYLQVPAMYEWSLLKLDRHSVPIGEDFRGWRTVLSQLIIKEIMTEVEAHRVFGQPQSGIVSSLYRRTLWDFRNGIRRD